MNTAPNNPAPEPPGPPVPAESIRVPTNPAAKKRPLTWDELPEICTVEQVASYTQSSRSLIRNYLYAKLLKGFKLGDMWRIRKTELAKFLARQER